MQCQVIDVIIMSVCLSVCNVGGSGVHSLGWKSWKLFARTISQAPVLFVAQRSSTYSQGNIRTWWNLGRLEVGWEKVACWSTKAVISLKRV